VQAWQPDWSPNSRTLAFLLCGKHAQGGKVSDDYIYMAMNMYHEDLSFELPAPPNGMRWHIFVNTGVEAPGDCHEPGYEPPLHDQHHILVGNRSVMVLVGK
jgi:glycogen operon protein